MGRKPRLHIEGGLYHVVTRGNNRKEIFKEKDDYTTFLETLRKLKEKISFKLFAYCLMPNHFHLLMEVNKINTSTIMQRLLTSYTKYFNKKYRKTGHLFQGRYKSIICEKDNYLLELVRYIHLNPYRAKLVKRPLDWDCSGHKEYLSGSGKLLDIEDVLGMISSNYKRAVTQYAEFIREGSRMGKRMDYYPKEKIPYIGSDAFIEELTCKHEDLVVDGLPELRIDTRISLKDILEKVSGENNVKADAVVNGVRGSEVSKARTQFIIKALESGYKGKDIAGFINCSECYITKVKSK